jgi:hypothetical protein
VSALPLASALGYAYDDVRERPAAHLTPVLVVVVTAIGGEPLRPASWPPSTSRLFARDTPFFGSTRLFPGEDVAASGKARRAA